PERSSTATHAHASADNTVVISEFNRHISDVKIQFKARRYRPRRTQQFKFVNTLMPEFPDAAFGKEIHQSRQRDHDQSERRVNERRDDGCNIDKNGDEIFPRHSLVQPLELGFVMITRDRFAQEKKRNGARRGDGGIKRDWKWQRVIVAEINRYPRDERDPKKQIDVCPKNDRIDPVHEVNEMMMIDPIDRNDDEAQDISEKGWPHPRQRSGRRIVRRLQLQDHDGNEDRHHAVAERFDAGGFHARSKS